jgi:hypothetical protein
MSDELKCGLCGLTRLQHRQHSVEHTFKQHQPQTTGQAADLKAQLTALRDENRVLREALEFSMQALDDWLHVHAPDECNANDVARSRSRISKYGTIGYIATVQEGNRKALAPKPEPQ